MIREDGRKRILGRGKNKNKKMRPKLYCDCI